MKNRLIFILVFCVIISCKENNTEKITEVVTQEIQNETAKFPTTVNTCDKTKYLLDALPHVDKVADYNFVKVGCFANTIVAKYKHKSENYGFQAIIYDEKADKKPMRNIGTFLYETTVKQEVNGNRISDLNIFDNAVMTIKKSKEFYNIKYLATYKENYSIAITIQSAELTNKKETDTFLAPYLTLFKKGVLN